MPKEDKFLGLRENEEVFVSYKDDDEKIVSGYFVLVSISENLLQIKSNSNVVVIPLSRLLKVKQRCSSYGNY